MRMNIEVFLKQLHREMNSILNNVHTYISKKYGIPQKKIEVLFQIKYHAWIRYDVTTSE